MAVVRLALSAVTDRYGSYEYSDVAGVSAKVLDRVRPLASRVMARFDCTVEIEEKVISVKAGDN